MLLADAGNKILLAQYTAANPTYRRWAARRRFNGFKPHNFLRMGVFPAFKNLAEAGEVYYGAMSENREQVSAAGFATGVRISRATVQHATAWPSRLSWCQTLRTPSAAKFSSNTRRIATFNLVSRLVRAGRRSGSERRDACRL